MPHSRLASADCVKKCLVVALINKGHLSGRAAIHHMIERSSNCIRNGRDMSQLLSRNSYNYQQKT